MQLPKGDAGRESLCEELEQQAKEKLADYKRPKPISLVEGLPRNAAGSFSRRAAGRVRREG